MRLEIPIKRFESNICMKTFFSLFLIIFLFGVSVLKAQTAPVEKIDIDIPDGAQWRLLKGNQRLDRKWKDIDFKDSNWLKKRSGFGYGNTIETNNFGSIDTQVTTDLAGMKGNYRNIFVRKEVEIDDPSDIETMTMTIESDGPYAVYLNGIKIVQSEGRMNKKIDLSGWCHELLPGTNVVCIEANNDNINSNSFTFVPKLHIEGKKTKDQ